MIDKFSRKHVYSYGVHLFNKDLDFNKKLEKLSGKKTNKFNQDLYDKGIEYFNLGGNIEEVTDDLKNDFSFLEGYNYAKRLVYIKQMEEKHGKNR